ELNVLQNADRIVSVGQTMSDEFHEMFLKAGGTATNKFKVITNGYDEDDVVKKENIIKDQKFSIAHIGTLVKDRNPEVLWKVLSKLVKENSAFEKELEIKLVGKVDIFVKERIAFYCLNKYVNKIEYLPHDEVIAEQQRSKVLLLLVNNTKNAKGILTGKFFEYMASKVPVLAIGPVNGDLAKIIIETSSGIISDFNDEVTLEKNILKLFSNPEFSSNTSAIEKYSRKNLTKELTACLNSI
ncbi:MAG: glycosyltransferase, partial [Bacteroidia bacterium]